MKTIFIFAMIAVMVSPSYAALIHHYNFNTDASDLVGSENGALISGASVSGGKLNLDGVDDYVQFGAQIVPTSGSYTVALFAQQASSQATYVELISQGFSGGPGFYLGHDPSGNIRATDSWISTGVAFPSDGQFHHYSLVVDTGSSSSSLYLDGLLQATLGSAIATTNSGDGTRLGRQFGGIAEYFHGALDDVRIYDYALTSNEVLDLANNVSSVPVPVAIWLFGSGLVGLIGMRKKTVRFSALSI